MCPSDTSQQIGEGWSDFPSASISDNVICWVPSSHPGEFSKVTELIIKRLIHYIAFVTASWVWV